VVVAAQAALLDEAVGEIGAAMRAMAVDHAVGAGEILVEDEVLAEQPHGFHRVAVELADAGDRPPVAAQEIAHRGARADRGQQLVLRFRKHASPPQCPLERRNSHPS
jgi:hypothetical protein